MQLTITDVNKREIYRYLGYRGQVPDETVCNMVNEVLQELFRVIQPRSLYQTFVCKVENDGIQICSEITNVSVSFHSKGLAENLAQCEKVVLMAATLGLEADKMMQRYEIMNIAKAAVLQACGAASIEAYCNLLQEDIRKQALQDGYYLRPRFSPGYGDWSLEAQKDIFDMLQCTKRLGLTLTDSLLMFPTKSVTALIGMTKNKQGCHVAKCSTCENIGCEFRYDV